MCWKLKFNFNQLYTYYLTFKLFIIFYYVNSMMIYQKYRISSFEISFPDILVNEYIFRRVLNLCVKFMREMTKLQVFPGKDDLVLCIWWVVWIKTQPPGQQGMRSRHYIFYFGCFSEMFQSPLIILCEKFLWLKLYLIFFKMRILWNAPKLNVLLLIIIMG